MSRWGALALLGLGSVAAVGLGVGLGAVGLGPGEVWSGLRGEGDPAAVTIVRELRLPRAVLAALVGAALAVAGATFQALLRNPLAEPYILGVSGGAALGAVVAIGAGWTAAAGWSLPVAALAGAVAAIAIVLRIARVAGGGLDVRVLLLAGVVVGTFFNAAILLALSFQEAETFRAAVHWMMGGLAGASWAGVLGLGSAVAAATAVLVALARPFDLIAVGEEPAGYLGVPVERVRLVAYLVASLLTAIAVVVAGGIGFVGLFVPHTVRMLGGAEHRFLLPASLLAGAAFLPLADVLARLVVAPAELPLGVVTAFVGVPFFIGVLRRQTARPVG